MQAWVFLLGLGSWYEARGARVTSLGSFLKPRIFTDFFTDSLFIFGFLLILYVLYIILFSLPTGWALGARVTSMGSYGTCK